MESFDGRYFKNSDIILFLILVGCTFKNTYTFENALGYWNVVALYQL